LHSPKIDAERVACSGTWSAPLLFITNLNAVLYDGVLTAQGDLDVVTRNLRLGMTSDFDPHRIAPVLPGTGRQWLEQFSWAKAPRLSGELSVVLPAWTNRQPDWRKEVQPTVRLQGEFNLDGNGAYRRIEVNSARSHFIYSNLCWCLPDLTVTRPEGGLRAVHQANDRTKDFSWQISSSLDPRIVLPFLDDKQRRAFDLITLTQPPIIEGNIWGRFHEPQRTGFSGRIALTNFAFRGESMTGLQTGLRYTNQVLQVLSPRIQFGARQVSADGLTANFTRQVVFLTNGFSTADPNIIARVIGPHVWRAIEPYQFLQPPTARVYGTIPMRGEAGADLNFDLDGGP
jgi:hypothetical protein